MRKWLLGLHLAFVRFLIFSQYRETRIVSNSRNVRLLLV